MSIHNLPSQRVATPAETRALGSPFANSGNGIGNGNVLNQRYP